MKQNLPLQGITVVDLSRVLAGPYCTLMLADLGARVIKVESPQGGDDSRQVGPFVDNESVYFASINRHKESIALDLKTTFGREVLDALLTRADVLIENYRPGVMDRLGYGWDVVKDKYPALIYASISGFGQGGPWRSRPAYDMVVQALGGIMSVTGEQDGRPVRVGVSIGDLASGLYATIGVQSALWRRVRTGVGERVDISMLDCQAALMENAIARYSATGVLPRALGSRHASITPFDSFRVADGYIVLAVGNDSLFARLCVAVGHPEWASDPRFALLDARNDHHEALKQLLEERLSIGTKATWADAFERAGIPHGSLSNVDDLLNNEQIAARNMVLPMKIGADREIRVSGNPIRLSASPPMESAGRAPRLNEDGLRILAELGINQEVKLST